VGSCSYEGFIAEALSQVPNALPPQSPGEYGILIYAQEAAQVHTRLTDILPGDVFVLDRAIFETSYVLYIKMLITDEGRPPMGIVSKFDPKKRKLEAVQANHQLGYQAVRISFASSYVAERVFFFLACDISNLQAERPEKRDDQGEEIQCAPRVQVDSLPLVITQ